jgi:hypothetical protein
MLFMELVADFVRIKQNTKVNLCQIPSSLMLSLMILTVTTFFSNGSTHTTGGKRTVDWWYTKKFRNNYFFNNENLETLIAILKLF